MLIDRCRIYVSSLGYEDTRLDKRGVHGTGRHWILVKGCVPDLCMQGLLVHVRLNTGQPNRNRFVVSDSDLIGVYF